MNEDGTTNSRIVDSVSSVVTLVTGESPAQSFGMLDAVMAETLGMAMHNAVMRQQAASMVSSAAVTAACAKMLQTPYAILPPPDPPLMPLRGVQPLDGPPSRTADVIAAAAEQAETGIHRLKAEVIELEQDTAAAEAALKAAAADATAPPAGGQTTSGQGTS
jgi:hypothetical protein